MNIALEEPNLPDKESHPEGAAESPVNQSQTKDINMNEGEGNIFDKPSIHQPLNIESHPGKNS